MRPGKAVSEVRLQRLMSELVSLREQVEQAERDHAISQVGLATAIAAAQAKQPPDAMAR
jgi:hypothetical protein